MRKCNEFEREKVGVNRNLERRTEKDKCNYTLTSRNKINNFKKEQPLFKCIKLMRTC